MKIVGLSSFHGLNWKKTVKFSLFKSHHGKAIDFLTGYEFKFFSKKKEPNYHLSLGRRKAVNSKLELY